MDWDELQEVARRGSLSSAGTDDMLRRAHKAQNERCPFCQDTVDWHRGVVYEWNTHLAWVCMLCAVLELRPDSVQNERHSGAAISELVPLPPGYQFVWLRKTNIAEPHDTQSAIELMRCLGPDFGLHFAMLAMEFTGMVSYLPPARPNDWTRTLLPVSPFHPFGEADIRTYLGSPEEHHITRAIHRVTGPAWVLADDPEPYGHDDLEILSDDLLANVSKQSIADRRTFVPRIGRISRTDWENAPRDADLDLRKVALTRGYHPRYYLIPYSQCLTFYGLDEMEREQIEMDPGFNKLFGASHRSLWEAVFGESGDSLDQKTSPNQSN